jgi:hypothetical protein
MNPGAIRRGAIPNPQMHTCCNRPVRLETKIALSVLSGGLTGSLITLAAGFALTPYVALGAVVGVVVGVAIALLTKPKATNPSVPPIIPGNHKPPVYYYEGLLNSLLNVSTQVQPLAKLILEANDAPTDLSPTQLEAWTNYVLKNGEFPSRIGDDAIDGHIVFEVLKRLMRNIDVLSETFDGKLGGPNEFMDNRPFWCIKEEHHRLVKSFLGICNLRLKNSKYYRNDSQLMAGEIASVLFPGLYDKTTYRQGHSRDERFLEETAKAIRLTTQLLLKSPTTIVEGVEHNI